MARGPASAQTHMADDDTTSGAGAGRQGFRLFPRPPRAGGPRVPAVLDQAAALSWRFLVVVAAVVVIVKVLIEVRLVVLPLVVALFFSTVLVPPTRWLRNHRWPAPVAAVTVMLLTLLVIGGGIALVGSAVVDELGHVGDVVSQGVDDFKEWLADGPLGISSQDLDRWTDRLGEQLSGGSTDLVDRAVRAGTLVFELLAGLILAFVITFFIVKDGARFGPWLTGVLPERYSDELSELGRRTWGTLVGYLRGIAITGVVDGLFIGIGLLVLGVPLALPLGVLTFFGAFIPLVGAASAGVVATVVALVTSGFTTALAVVALTVAVQQIEGHLLAPFVLGRAVRLHPVTILLALTAGAAVAGIVGAFLVVPFTAVAKTVIDFYRGRPQPEPPPGPLDQGNDGDDGNGDGPGDPETGDGAGDPETGDGPDDHRAGEGPGDPETSDGPGGPGRSSADLPT